MAEEPALASRESRPLGRYVLGELLGRGGMGEVFAGFAYGSHGFQKPVAIKRIVPELANDETFVERLISEAKVLVGMQHSNIVSVLDLAREGDDVFLVMEFVDGPSLHELLKARARNRLTLSFGIASYIIQSAAAGLQFAHERRGGAIIHADISPSNLLLSTAGEVRVADFGIAQREGRAAGVEGKWAYMAPEQLRGEPLTRRCDVFALGIVLYELITGRHPFGLDITLGGRLGQPHRVVPPRAINPAVPPALDEVCLRSLSEDPNDRFATMAELNDALTDQRFANGWREGASDLATAIRETTELPQRDKPATQVTASPVTIMTSSLIKSRPAALPTTVPGNPGTDPIELAPTGLFGVIHEPSGAGPVPAAEPAGMSHVATAPESRSDDYPTIERPLSSALVDSPVAASRRVAREPTELTRDLVSRLVAGARAHRTLVIAGFAAVALGVVVAVVATSGPRLEEPPARHPAVADVAAPSTMPATPAEPAPTQVASSQAPQAVVPPDAAVVEAAADSMAGPPESVEKTTVEPKHAVATPAPTRGEPSRPKRRVEPPVHKQAQSGWLRVTTADGAWAKATVGSETLDIPGASFELEAGTSTVTVKDGTVMRRCDVDFQPGTQTLTVTMKTGKCVVR